MVEKRRTDSSEGEPPQHSHSKSDASGDDSAFARLVATRAPRPTRRAPSLAETFVGRAREIGLLETAFGDTNDGS